MSPHARLASTILGVGPTPTAEHPALGVTIAAPPPTITIDLTTTRAVRTTNASILPRLEPAAEGMRLVPNEGRRYEPVKTLGRGGMGEVALVEDRDIGRSVALKRLIGGAPSSVDVARFVDEVRTIGRLEHPNIIPIHDVGVDENGALFFVMKFVDGETLESVIERMRAGDADTIRQYDATRCAEIFVGLLRALQFAHERGIVHRDIKPANVMVGRFGEVVLMDWGIARPIGGADHASTAPAESRASVTHVGTLIGTPLYMSPEQAAGENETLDARSDLYSACTLFYELLNHGHHRFGTLTTLGELLSAIQTTDPVSPARFFDHAAVGAEYVHFVRRGLARSKSGRWQSAAQMIDELHLIADGRFRVQCPMTLTKRITRGIGRGVDRRPLTTVLGVAFTSLAVLALFANAAHDLALWLGA